MEVTAKPGWSTTPWVLMQGKGTAGRDSSAWLDPPLYRLPSAEQVVKLAYHANTDKGIWGLIHVLFGIYTF